MIQRLLQWTLPTLALGAAFLAGHGVAGLEGQGRNSGGQREPTPPPSTSIPVTPVEDVVYFEQGGGSGGAAGDLIAVTGSWGVGTQVLYVVDAKTRNLAVYEARGGSKSTRRLTFVGARKIDLDLQLEGYNDESEFDYQALRQRFEKRNK